MQKRHLAKFNTDSCLKYFIKLELIDSSPIWFDITINLKFFGLTFPPAAKIIDYKVHLDEETIKLAYTIKKKNKEGRLALPDSKTL